MLASTSVSHSCVTRQWLRVSVAAKCYGVSDQTIRNEIDRGNLSAVRTSGGHRRISLTSLREFFEGVSPEDDAGVENEGCGVVVYCRVSSEKQNQRGSLERQIGRLLTEVVTREGVNRDSVKVYKEICSSYSNRPILNCLISDIIGGKVRKLYCECEDRLSRISSTTSLIYHLCKQFGVVVVCLDKDETNEDELEAGMKELLAHAGIITARIHAKKSTLVTRKSVTGEAIARMVALRQKGHTLLGIYHQLSKEGFQTSHGDSISYGKVRQIIDSNGAETILTKVVCGEHAKVEESCQTFIENHISKAGDSQITMGDIYPRYVSYCESQSKLAQPRNVLGRYLIKTLGKHGKKILGQRYWVGFTVN